MLLFTLTKLFAAVVPTYTMEAGINYEENNIGKYVNFTKEKCKQNCDVDPKCLGYVVDTSGDLCWTKNVLGNRVQHSLRISYLKTIATPAVIPPAPIVPLVLPVSNILPSPTSKIITQTPTPKSNDQIPHPTPILSKIIPSIPTDSSIKLPEKSSIVHIDTIPSSTNANLSSKSSNIKKDSDNNNRPIRPIILGVSGGVLLIIVILMYLFFHSKKKVQVAFDNPLPHYLLENSKDGCNDNYLLPLHNSLATTVIFTPDPDPSYCSKLHNLSIFKLKDKDMNEIYSKMSLADSCSTCINE